jgi:hypothetical protein
VHRSDGEEAFPQTPKAEAQPAKAKQSTEIPEDLSIPQFLRREQNSQPPSVGATKPNGSRPPQNDEPAENADIAAPQQSMQPPANEPQQGVQERTEANTDQPISPVLEQQVAPHQHKQPVAVEQPGPKSEQYLDRSVDPETQYFPLVLFPRLNRVIPQSETDYVGWSAFIDAVAPTPAPVVQEKKDVPYVIAGTLQEAPLSKAAQEELRRAGKEAVIGKARSNKCIASLGPAFLLDDDTIDGDVFNREARLKALGLAAFIYSSHSYGFGKMGGRVGVCLNRAYAPDEHKPLWYGICHLLGGEFDAAGQTLSQCYGMHARRSHDAQHKRVVLPGTALDADALIALGRRFMPAKKAQASAAEHLEHGVTIEEIRSAVEFLSGYLDDHPEALTEEHDWMNLARSFAHQAWRCPDQREELERLLDELSQKARGYDQEENAARFDRYIAEASERPATGDIGGARTITSFFAWVRELGWTGINVVRADFVPSDKYEPVTRDAPELAKNVGAAWITRIFNGDTDGKCQGDLAFTVACELVRLGFNEQFIARVIMTTACGAHVQEQPEYRLPQTIRRARDFVVDPDLETMNSRHAVLPLGGMKATTLVATWGDDLDFPGRKTIIRAQSFPDFRNLHSNKRKAVVVKDEHGKTTTKKIPIGTWWLNQTQRRQYDGGRRFMPQYEKEVVGDTLNMFEGFAVQARKPEGRSGARGCQKFLDHGFKIMCNGNEEHWFYLLRREAWIAQYRLRCEIAAGYRTEAEGSGKGFWCNHLGHLYGRHYMQIQKAEHVVGKHNAHLEMLLKLCADEALFVHDPRHRNALFGQITEPTIPIEPKFVNPYSAPNYLNIDTLTNSRHFVPVSPTARRFFIPTVSEDRVGDLEYFNAIEAQLKDGGYEALLYHLKYEVDLRDFDVRKVPKTAALAEQAAYSRKGVDGLVEQLCSEGLVPCAFVLDWPDFSIAADGSLYHEKGFDTFISTHPDRDLRNFGALRVKNTLRKEWGCTTGTSARKYHNDRLIHGVQWPPLKELRAKFEQRHGPQEWLQSDLEDWGLPLGQARIVSTVAEPDV